MRTRVETKGSIWLLDDDLSRYARMPKQEGPRYSPPGEDWGGVDAGILQDLVWHPMERWEIRQNPIREARLDFVTMQFEWVDTDRVQPILVIFAVGEEAVVAPDAVILDS